MGYHQEIYRRIRESYQEKYKKAFDEADRRTEQLHRLSPELTEIDRELSKTFAQFALEEGLHAARLRDILQHDQEKQS